MPSSVTSRGIEIAVVQLCAFALTLRGGTGSTCGTMLRSTRRISIDARLYLQNASSLNDRHEVNMPLTVSEQFKYAAESLL